MHKGETSGIWLLFDMQTPMCVPTSPVYVVASYIWFPRLEVQRRLDRALQRVRYLVPVKSRSQYYMKEMSFGVLALRHS